MVKGLAVADVVNVAVNLAPTAAAYRNFGGVLIVGPSTVIDTNELIRQYSQLDQVVADFGTSAPEYQAAALHFSQSPQSNLLYIGRWAQTATSGLLHGGILSASQQILANFTAISTGTLTVSIDGVAKTLTGLDFHLQTNLNGVASVVQTALVAAGATGSRVIWGSANQRFDIISGTTGAASSVGYATGTAAVVMGLVSGVASPPVAGIIAETALQNVAKMADRSGAWYAITFASATMPSQADVIQIAALVEGLGVSRIFGFTTQETAALDATSTTDTPYLLKVGGYTRTMVQYSSSNPFAVNSLLARFATVDYSGTNTTITGKFKLEPGVVAEYLTESQAAALNSKNCNVFVNYQNDTAIVQQGQMSSGLFIDTRIGADYVQNTLQNDLYNVLYTSPKVPQTDPGVAQLLNQANATCAGFVRNGLVAPGQWNLPGFGLLKRGDGMPGFYCFALPVALQSQADRDARKAPLIQIALKLAGAIHSANVAVSVNN